MRNDEKVNFRVEEVIDYLEVLIVSDEATPEEEYLYQDYHWYGTLRKDKVLKKVLRKMGSKWKI